MMVEWSSRQEGERNPSLFILKQSARNYFLVSSINSLNLLFWRWILVFPVLFSWNSEPILSEIYQVLSVNNQGNYRYYIGRVFYWYRTRVYHDILYNIIELLLSIICWGVKIWVDKYKENQI